MAVNRFWFRALGLFDFFITSRGVEGKNRGKNETAVGGGGFEEREREREREGTPPERLG